jgi:hypothetical protein
VLSRASGASNSSCIHHGPRHRVHGTPDGAALLAADDPTHLTVVTPLAHPTVFTPSILLTVGVMRVRHAGEGGEPNQTARSVATGASHRLHTSVAPHRPHTVDSTGCWRPARPPRLLRAPQSSHSRLHWPLASCACAAPAKEESPIRLLVPLPPPRPTVFTPLARPTIF